MDDVGPHLNELRTFDGELQPTIIDAVDDNVSIAGIGDRRNGSMDDRQPIGSNERAATIGTDHTDNHHTVVVDAERRSAFLSEHPNGHGRWPHQGIAFDWDDHRRSSEYQRMTNDQTTSDDDIDLDRRCERRQKVELDRTETGNEFDRRREGTTGGIDPIASASNSIEPLQGFSSPSMRSVSVDLPLPEGPTSATMPPGRTSKETESSKGGFRGSNPKETPFICTRPPSRPTDFPADPGSFAGASGVSERSW